MAEAYRSNVYTNRASSHRVVPYTIISDQFFWGREGKGEGGGNMDLDGHTSKLEYLAMSLQDSKMRVDTYEVQGNRLII